jgi:hypothetical protein
MDTTLEYKLHQEKIADDLNRRIAAHQAKIAQRRMMLTATASGGPNSLNLIAQGDSWFDYPLPLLAPSDVIAHLRSMPLSPTILSLAHHGEAAEDMLGVRKLKMLKEQLEDVAHNGAFDAILFSGGGNDLVGDQFRLWINDSATVDGDSAQALRDNRAADILGVVQAAYEDLVAMRDKIATQENRSIPIFVHSYDFAIPSGIGVCGAGPWIKPGLDDRGWSQDDGPSIVKALLLEFDELLNSMAAHAADFIVVPTQGTLSAGQWANELHPTPEGFAAITAKFVTALRDHFPGRI